jgi:hypothetical protein
MKKVLALCAVLLATPALAQTSSSSADLEELAGRLLGYGSDTTPEFFVRTLPDQSQLKVAVPLPQGARVVGAAKLFENYFEIVLDVKADTDAILNFYTSSLKDFEDRGALYNGPRGGFSFSNRGSFEFDSKDTLFCKGEQAFHVIVNRTNAAIKDVRIQLNQFNCQGDQDSIVLPRLLPPKGAEVRSLSSYGREARSLVTLDNVTSPKAAFDEYAAQLEAAKWKKSEVVTLQVGIAATFDLTDENGKAWRMFFTVHSSSQGQIAASMFAFAV